MNEATRDLFDEWARKGRGEGMEEGHFPRAEQALENMPVMPGEMIRSVASTNDLKPARRSLVNCTIGAV